jgi:hypothetical protein
MKQALFACLGTFLRPYSESTPINKINEMLEFLIRPGGGNRVDSGQMSQVNNDGTAVCDRAWH